MKSERLFKEVMSRILANGSVEQDDNKIIEMALKLSQVYAMWGDHEKASAGFRFCVDTQERKVAAAGANADEAGSNLNFFSFSNKVVLYNIVQKRKCLPYAGHRCAVGDEQ